MLLYKYMVSFNFNNFRPKVPTVETRNEVKADTVEAIKSKEGGKGLRALLLPLSLATAALFSPNANANNNPDVNKIDNDKYSLQQNEQNADVKMGIKIKESKSSKNPDMWYPDNKIMSGMNSLSNDPIIQEQVSKIRNTVESITAEAMKDLPNYRFSLNGDPADFMVNMSQQDSVFLKNVINKISTSPEIAKQIADMNKEIGNNNQIMSSVKAFGESLNKMSEKMSDVERDIDMVKNLDGLRDNYSLKTKEYNTVLATDNWRKNIYHTTEVHTEMVVTKIEPKNTNKPFGNTEIYALMRAVSDGYGKQIAGNIANTLGCDPSNVKSSVKVLATAHLNSDGTLNETPFNNIHPVTEMEMCNGENSFGKVAGIIRLYNSSNGIGAPDLNKFKIQETKMDLWDVYGWKTKENVEDLGTVKMSGIAPMVAVAGVRLTNKLFGNIDLETNVGVQLGYETSHNFSKDLPDWTYS